MSTWKELTERLKELQREFIRIAQRLEADKRNRPGVCGSWSPREVVAHLVEWNKEVIRQFEFFQVGLYRPVDHDLDEFNERSVRQRAHMTWEETIGELIEIHELFHKKTESISMQDISANGEYKDWVMVQIEHYEHHTRQLQQWI